MAQPSTKIAEAVWEGDGGDTRLRGDSSTADPSPSGDGEAIIRAQGRDDEPAPDSREARAAVGDPVAPLAPEMIPPPPQMAPGLGGFNIEPPPTGTAKPDEPTARRGELLLGDLEIEPQMQDRRLVIFEAAAPELAKRKAALIRFGIMLAIVVVAFVSLMFFDPARKQVSNLIAALTPLLEHSSSETLPPRLLVESRPGSPNEPIPVGVSVEHASGGETVTIDGLANGTELSLGSLDNSSAWVVAAQNLDQTFVGAPKNFVGVMAATVNLRSASGRLLDRQTLRLEWIATSGAEAASKEEPTGAAVTAAEPSVSVEPAPRVPPARPEQAAVAAAATEPVRAAPVREAASPPRPLDAQEIAALTGAGQNFLKNGDIVSARVLFRRAALAGSAEAALALGMSFDPLFLQQLHVLGVEADLASARDWYERASKLGSGEASRRLDRLASMPK